MQEVTIAGHRLPVDSIVLPQVSAVLEDPRLYPDGNVFRPERFLSSDMLTIDKTATDNVFDCLYCISAATDAGLLDRQTALFGRDSCAQ